MKLLKSQESMLAVMRSTMVSIHSRLDRLPDAQPLEAKCLYKQIESDIDFLRLNLDAFEEAEHYKRETLATFGLEQESQS